MLRQHQQQALIIAESPECGTTIRTVVASVTPGGGKSVLPVIFAKNLLRTGRAAKICWIAPRSNLREQGERAFMDRRFRDFLDHDLEVRKSTNEIDPSRNSAGYVTTYQAIERNAQLHADEFARHPYILVLDEVHHLAYGEAWHRAVQPLWDRAVVRLVMTGSLVRADNKPIAFLDYGEPDRAGRTLVALNNTAETKIITYALADALREKAVVPMYFELVDGTAKWLDTNGEEREVECLSGAGDDTAAALCTVLNEDFAFDLLEKAFDHWRAHKQVNQHSKLLVVAPNITLAKKYEKWLRHQPGKVHCAIATSDDSEEAHVNIGRLRGTKKPDIDILVTVAMAYEGLDCPGITHIACLTNIRSKPWIEQMLARATRFNPKAGAWEQQAAFIWAPDDVMFQECIAEIQAAQAPYITTTTEVVRDQKSQTERDIAAPIIPLEARVTAIRARDMHGEEVSAQDYEELTALASQTQLNGVLSLVQLKRLRDAVRSPVAAVPAAPISGERTLSEREADLRSQIDQHVRRVCSGDGDRIKQMNGTIMRLYGQSRKTMNETALKRVLNERSRWCNVAGDGDANYA